ncbi:MAG: HD domain-containing protein [Deltaproteobacteria bacterium]|nr:HD domain-containing protein [Deltaproteobacteria bacterium]MBW1846446.1 HD domain-containing protein [Deltaproteobacteria bacterium]MBW2365940.1 HD domain-containing protein [Deltaproteobacteria bacterium]
MKKQFVSDLKSGDSVSDIFILSEKNMATKKDGDSYLNVTFSDKTGEIKGVVWDNVEQIANTAVSGNFVRIEGNTSEYKAVSQLVVRSMEKVSEDMVDPKDFLPSTKRDTEDMFQRLLMIIDSIEKGYIKDLFKAFWRDKDFVLQFKTAPAAKKMHHAYIGGLLEHTLSMASLADKIAGHYKGVDRDLLIAGAILHDIGKITEYTYRFNIDYSDKGRLLSHIALGLEMLNVKLDEIKDFPDEQAMLLKHLIISHHGVREFGSLEPPKTIEAVLLNYIDEIDAKVNGIRDFMDREEIGETWTSYHRMLGRHFYIGPEAEGNKKIKNKISNDER